MFQGSTIKDLLTPARLLFLAIGVIAGSLATLGQMKRRQR